MMAIHMANYAAHPADTDIQKRKEIRLMYTNAVKRRVLINKEVLVNTDWEEIKCSRRRNGCFPFRWRGYHGHWPGHFAFFRGGGGGGRSATPFWGDQIACRKSAVGFSYCVKASAALYIRFCLISCTFSPLFPGLTIVYARVRHGVPFIAQASGLAYLVRLFLVVPRPCPYLPVFFLRVLFFRFSWQRSFFDKQYRCSHFL